MLNRGMGDYRNKAAKDAYWAAIREMQARKFPLKPAPPPATCRCGLTWQETTLYGWSETKLSRRHLNGLWCLVCMPTELKMELIDIMVTQGISYDAGEHGE
jgi:hypothetical protein